MEKGIKIFTSVVALFVMFTLCLGLATTSVSAYTYGSNHVTGNLTSFTGELKADTVDKNENIYLTEADKLRADAGQLYIYATGDFWRQACATIKANLTITYYNSSGTKISSKKKSVDEYYSTGGYKNTLTIDYTKVPAGTSYVNFKVYSHNSLTYDMKVKNIKLYLKDETAPVYAATVPETAPGKYKLNDTLRYRIEFSEPVNVSSSGTLYYKVGSDTFSASYAGQNSNKKILYYDLKMPSTSTSGDNLTVTVSSIANLSVKDDAQNSLTVNKDLNMTNGFYVDNKPPAAKTMTTDASTGAVYKAGEKLVFDVAFTENVWVSGTPYITLSNGKKATYVKKTSTDTNLCSFEYVVAEGDDIENIAITGINFSGIYDSVNNNATSAPEYSTSKYNTFMDGRNVCIDTKAPDVQFPEEEQVWTKARDIIITPTDNISGVKAIYSVWSTIGDLPLRYPDAPNVDLATNAIATPKASGQYNLYVKTEDVIGNTSSRVSPYVYMIDADAPVIEKDYTTEQGMVNEITASATDAHSGVATLTYRWLNEEDAEVLSGNVEDGIAKPDSDGVYKVILTATDNVGYVAEETIEGLKVDSIAPTATFNANGSAEYEKSHTTTVSVIDAKSGVKEYYYLWSDSATAPEYEDENWVLADADVFTTPENKSGTYYLHIKAVDKVGNSGIITSGGFNIDNAAPEVILTPNGNSKFMGLDSLDVRVELKDQVSLNSEITAWYVVSEDKDAYGEMELLTGEVVTVDTTKVTKYLIIKAADKAGNETVYISEAFEPDLTAPTGTITKTEDKYYINTNTVNVNISATDDYSNEIWSQIKIDETEGDWAEYETIKTLEFEGTEGEHTISVRFKDRSGNISEYRSVTYYYDATAPEIAFEYSQTELTNQSVTVTATAEDAVSEVTFNTETSKVFDVNGSFEFVATDEAGNIARKVAVVENIDKIKPVITITSEEFDGKKHKSAKVKIEAYDANGVETLEYAVVERGSDASEMISVASGDEIEIKNLDGTYQVVVKATDIVGNEETKTSQAILFDNTVPTANISYEPSKRTARDVVATVTFNEDTVITNNSGSNTYTFTDNGEFTFEFEDEAGNVASETAVVTWIDRAQPTAKVILSDEGWVSDEITITLLPQPQSIIRNVKFNSEMVEENDLNTYTFREYGILEYEIYDIDTEVITEDSVVIKVDKTAPEVKEIHYSETDWTNRDVVVTVDAEDDLSEITYVNGKTYTFTENGEFTFKIKDSAGNTTEKKVVVDFIDKVVPVPTITYYVNDEKYDVNTPTNQNVVAKVTFDEGGAPVEISNNDGCFDYEFEANGNFTFMFRDKAGNMGEAEAIVSKIDKIAPTGYVTYSKSSWTNMDVVATLVASDDVNEVIITNNEGSENYTFTENGEFVFEFKDAAGNTATVKAQTQIIDKTAPTLTYTLSTTEPTPFSVFATVSADENVTFINNDGKPTRQFTSNGEYRFEVVDRAGNIADINVVVTNISKDTTPVKLTYSKTTPTNQDVFVTIASSDGKSYIYVTNNDGQKTKRFTENGEFTFVYKNAAGIEGEATASVTNIDKIAPTVTVTYSHDKVTNEDVTATFICEEDVEYPYLIIDNKYTFTENKKISFPVSDKAGNITNVIAETNLIDKSAPVIEVKVPFDMIGVGAEFDVMSGVSVSDENEIDGEITVIGEVDNQKAGNYTITYQAKDIAGNIGEAIKCVTVYDPDGFNVFVNGQMAFSNQINLNSPKLEITAINAEGNLVARYLPGKKAVGDFKTKGTKISLDGELPGVGYYTVYMRDDDRNARIAYIFVQE
ncbi:MAG: DUF5011 domain-containing protein [Clostridia bacterium]|nr:DUF5011 domain-containing protein [Clostridia bacterium]